MKFRCPHCGQKYRADTDLIARGHRCRHCGTRVEPMAEPELASTVPAQPPPEPAPKTKRETRRTAHSNRAPWIVGGAIIVVGVAVLLLFFGPDKAPSPKAHAPPAANAPGDVPTGLHAASQHNDIRAVKTMLAARADVNARDGEGHTPLHKAAAAGHGEMAVLLIEHGADVNARAPRRLTALHLAALSGHKGVAALLIKKGAAVNATTKDGATPLQFANYMRHFHVAQLLVAKGARLESTKGTAGRAKRPTAKGRRRKPKLAGTAEKVFKAASPAVVFIETTVSKDEQRMGSGFLVSSDGLVVTNFHVIEDASSVSVRVNRRTILQVTGVRAVDRVSDLALLQVTGKDFPFLKVASRDQRPNIGAKVYAIGHPRGYTNTLTEGLVSGAIRKEKGARWLQTSAPVSPGSSGGPLLNGDGLVVGVVTWHRPEIRSQNLNFASPAERVLQLLKNKSKPKSVASASGAGWQRLVALAKRQYDAENYQSAIDNYKKVIALRPNHGETYVNLGKAYHLLDRYGEAIAAYKKATALLPVSSNELGWAYFCLGYAYEALKDADSALQAYRSAVRYGLPREKQDYAQERIGEIASQQRAAAVEADERRWQEFQRTRPDWRKRRRAIATVLDELGGTDMLASPYLDLYELAGMRMTNKQRYARVRTLVLAGYTLKGAKKVVSDGEYVDLFKNEKAGEILQGKWIQEATEDGKGFIVVRLSDGTTRTLLKDEWEVLSNQRGLTDRTDIHGALVYAAFDGNFDVARTLLDQGADANGPDGAGRPLCHVAASGRLDIAELLVSRGANVNAKGADGLPPLICAIYYPRPKMVEYLLAKGAKPNAVSGGASSALHWAVGAYATQPRQANTIVRALLDKGAKANAKDKHGWTPLHWAVSEGHTGVAKVLLARGADANAKDEEGWTPLHWAAFTGYAPVAQALFDKGANAKAKDKHGRTPLYYAAQEGHAEVAKALLDKGADANARNKNGWTPLHSAACDGHTEIAKVLLDKGADVNAKSKVGWTPLHSAAAGGHTEVAKLLLDKRANVNARNKNGWTPLHNTAAGGHTEVAKVLLDKGANVNAKDKDDYTPLHYAAFEGRAQVAKMLLDKGASVNAKDKGGSTPLHFAVEKGHQKLVDLLRKHGAKK